MKRPTLSYQEAFDVYFGGVKAIAGSSLPFKCKRCSAQTTTAFVGDKEVTKGLMDQDGIWFHIRYAHGERIRKFKPTIGA